MDITSRQRREVIPIRRKFRRGRSLFMSSFLFFLFNILVFSSETVFSLNRPSPTCLSPFFRFFFLIKAPPLCGGAFLYLLNISFFLVSGLSKTIFPPFQTTSFPLQISLFPYFIPFYPFFIPFSPSSRFLSNNFLKNFIKIYCFFCKYMV